MGSNNIFDNDIQIRSLDAMHKLFERFPEAFMNSLHVPLRTRCLHLFSPTNHLCITKLFDSHIFSSSGLNAYLFCRASLLSSGLVSLLIFDYSLIFFITDV